MNKYKIPDNILPGFRILAKLNSDQMEEFLAVLNDFQAGENLQYLQKQLSVLPFLKDPELMARTIFSFGNLILREGKDVEFLADDLSDAYISMEQADKNVKVDLEEKATQFVSGISGSLSIRLSKIAI